MSTNDKYPMIRIRTTRDFYEKISADAKSQGLTTSSFMKGLYQLWSDHYEKTGMKIRVKKRGNQ